MTDIGARPLHGYTVAVTADRRRAELASLLERRGARVVSAPTMRIQPLDESAVFAATQNCLRAPVDLLVVTTAIGLRSWLDAADGWGLGETLRAHLSAIEVVARGPKARGAVRAAGLRDGWTPASETMDEVTRRLLARDLRGQRVVVQLHGEPLTAHLQALRDAGADVVDIPVYMWAPPPHAARATRLVNLVVSRQVDAITFTSAPAVDGLLRIARNADRDDALLDALRTDVVPVCIGAVCATPLARIDVPTVQPARARLGDLVRTLASEVPTRRASTLRVANRRLEIRGHLVVVDDRVVDVPPAPMAVLRALARQPGRVLDRDELARALPADHTSDEPATRPGGHAIEMAVTRLRALLGDRELVQTVVKRGYRLPV